MRAARILKIPPWELLDRPALWQSDQLDQLAFAADWLGIDPAILAQQPWIWIEWALMSANAESYAERYERDRMKLAGVSGV
jgi:hypothetical protein